MAFRTAESDECNVDNLKLIEFYLFCLMLIRFQKKLKGNIVFNFIEQCVNNTLGVQNE